MERMGKGRTGKDVMDKGDERSGKTGRKGEERRKAWKGVISLMCGSLYHSETVLPSCPAEVLFHLLFITP